MRPEEFRRDAAAAPLLGYGLRAVLTELRDGALSFGIGPGATRTVETVGLVDAAQQPEPLQRPGLREDVPNRRDHRGDTRRDLGRRPAANAGEAIRWFLADPRAGEGGVGRR